MTEAEFEDLIDVMFDEALIIGIQWLSKPDSMLAWEEATCKIELTDEQMLSYKRVVDRKVKKRLEQVSVYLKGAL